jgi:hypothetical protein
MKVIALVSGGKVVLRTHDPLPYNLMGFVRVRKNALLWKRLSVCITVHYNFNFIDSDVLSLSGFNV